VYDFSCKCTKTLTVVNPEVGLHENHWVAFASIAPHIAKDVFLLQENNFNAQEILNAFIKNIDSWMEEESISDIADFLVNFVRQNAPSILFKKSSREEDSLLPVVWWDVLIAAEGIPELAVLVDEGLKNKDFALSLAHDLIQEGEGLPSLARLAKKSLEALGGAGLSLAAPTCPSKTLYELLLEQDASDIQKSFGVGKKDNIVRAKFGK